MVLHEAQYFIYSPFSSVLVSTNSREKNLPFEQPYAPLSSRHHCLSIVCCWTGRIQWIYHIVLLTGLSPKKYQFIAGLSWERHWALDLFPGTNSIWLNSILHSLFTEIQQFPSRARTKATVTRKNFLLSCRHFEQKQVLQWSAATSIYPYKYVHMWNVTR